VRRREDPRLLTYAPEDRGADAGRDRHAAVRHRQADSHASVEDLDRLVALCPPRHAQTDAPYARGRLVVTPFGGGRFTSEVIRGVDEWAIRA
jgi:hypothetical protein